MNEAAETGREPAGEGPSVAGVAWRLALYVLPGAVGAMVVWELLSELLSGRVPSGGVVWLAPGLLVVLVAAVAALRKHVLSRE